jgi:hypothetical protein
MKCTAILAGLTLCLSSAAPLLADGAFQFTAPPADSILSTGQTVTIQWTGGDPAESVSVYLIDVTQNAAVAVVASNIPNSGTVDWTFPAVAACDHTYEFYIQNAAPTNWAYGPHFTVACSGPSLAPLEITSPPSGSILSPGQPVTVMWIGGDPAWFVDVYMIDLTPGFPFAVVATIGSHISNTGAAAFTFPASVLPYEGPCGHTYQFYVQEVSQKDYTYGPQFTVACGIAVAIDVKPGSFPNSINPQSNGVIPVAVLTTPTFDASVVDPASLTFGPSQAAPMHWAFEDVNHDGMIDLIVQFRAQQTGVTCGATAASLTGLTNTGQAIKGSDSVRTVGCH